MESNDRKFDELIVASLQSKAHREAMNERIMEAVARTARRQRRKVWLRMVAFALFVPLSMVGFVACILLAKEYLAEIFGVFAILPIALVAVVGVITEIKLVAHFSPYEV